RTGHRAADVFRDQAHDRERRHALAAARFADDAQRFAAPDIEGNTIHGAHHAVAAQEVRAQVAHRQYDLGIACHAIYIRRAMRGSSESRSPSPTRLIASTAIASIRPGKKMIQGEIWKKARPSEITLPQLGISGGVPAPRKERPASMRIAEAQT